MRHPIHPMLVHVPVACWLLTPLGDGAALLLGLPSLWRISAVLAAVGVAWGALAATAGAVDYARAEAVAPRLVRAHAGLMGSAWTVSLIGLFGRFAEKQVVVPPAPWAIAAGAVALLLMIAGAWCGGEMVYGRGVGVSR
jgi:uncharacterized membrane protein